MGSIRLYFLHRSLLSSPSERANICHLPLTHLDPKYFICLSSFFSNCWSSIVSCPFTSLFILRCLQHHPFFIQRPRLVLTLLTSIHHTFFCFITTCRHYTACIALPSTSPPLPAVHASTLCPSLSASPPWQRAWERARFLSRQPTAASRHCEQGKCAPLCLSGTQPSMWKWSECRLVNQSIEQTCLNLVLETPLCFCSMHDKWAKWKKTSSVSVCVSFPVHICIVPSHQRAD